MKLIPLNKKSVKAGKKEPKFAMVDDEDYEYLIQWEWSAVKDGQTFYATRTTIDKGEKRAIMHRLILNLVNSKMLVDHIDHNGLNNQRKNIRVATHSQNSMNQQSLLGSSSKYLGVAYAKVPKKWLASIQVKGKSISLGYFSDEVAAAYAYNKGDKIFWRICQLKYP